MTIDVQALLFNNNKKKKINKEFVFIYKNIQTSFVETFLFIFKFTI